MNKGTIDLIQTIMCFNWKKVPVQMSEKKSDWEQKQNNTVGLWIAMIWWLKETEGLLKRDLW